MFKTIFYLLLTFTISSKSIAQSKRGLYAKSFVKTNSEKSVIVQNIGTFTLQVKDKTKGILNYNPPAKNLLTVTTKQNNVTHFTLRDTTTGQRLIIIISSLVAGTYPITSADVYAPSATNKNIASVVFYSENNNFNFFAAEKGSVSLTILGNKASCTFACSRDYAGYNFKGTFTNINF